VSAPLGEVQLRAQIASVRRKLPDARRIGLKAPSSWSGPSRIRVEDGEADIVFCRSALAVREALASHEHEDRILVVLTDRDERELGDDVLARLAKRRLLRDEPWLDVMELFRARSVDPRISHERWMAHALLAAAPQERLPAAATGVLDAETAWGVLLKGLGLADGRPDARALLRWSLDSNAGERLSESPPEMLAAVRSWLVQSAGRVAEPILGCVENGRSRDAVAIGFVCRVVFGDSTNKDRKLRDASIRLEPLIGGRPLEPAVGRSWAEATEAVARDLVAAGAAPALAGAFERASEILRELHIPDQAWRSAVLPVGLEQRLDRYAEQATALLEGSADLAAVQSLADEALAHSLAATSDRRALAVQMSLRLLRWLAAPPRVEVRSLAEAIERYAAESSFVDFARESLADGDSSQIVSAAYSSLLQHFLATREGENARFAKLLSDWVASAAPSDGLVPIEEVLARVVSPLAEGARVLMLVLDGMSASVLRELQATLEQQGWSERIPVGGKRVRAVAVLPTLTEVSRTSLLCGQLRRGASGDEKSGFEANAALRAATGAGLPPVLFHKADLVAAGEVGLPDAMRSEITRSTRRIVGVVINAVDDFLAKGDQIHPRWGVDAIRPLRALLDLARESGRALVITSDHGHVLERGSELRRESSEGARCRSDNGRIEDGEVRLCGPRVLGLPGNAVIAAWSERIRYGAKQNGYHGGASPQEVVVPVAVFAPVGVAVPGWGEVADEIPGWWDGERAVEPAAPAVSESPRKGQITLRFDARESTHAPDAAWVGALFASAVYGTQKRLVARAAPPEERVRAALLALDARGGTLTTTALARAIDLPSMRVSGFLAVLRRLLNVEGYPVLTVNESGEVVVLNRDLLRVQFEIEE